MHTLRIGHNAVKRIPLVEYPACWKIVSRPQIIHVQHGIILLATIQQARRRGFRRAGRITRFHRPISVIVVMARHHSVCPDQLPVVAVSVFQEIGQCAGSALRQHLIADDIASNRRRLPAASRWRSTLCRPPPPCIDTAPEPGLRRCNAPCSSGDSPRHIDTASVCR